MRITSTAVLVALSTFHGALAAQTLEAAESAIRWRLEPDGSVAVFPDPYGGGDTGWRPIADPTDLDTWGNLGLLGVLGLALSGDADLASLADARRFWERLEVPPEELIHRLGGGLPASASRAERAQMILAIRALEDLGVKPAIGPLDELAGDDAVPQDVRRAAESAARALRGEEPPPAPALRPLAEVLAEVPEGCVGVLVADHARLPASRPLLALAREVGEMVTRRQIRMAGGSVSAAAWAGAARLAESPGVLPYEIARRFGNHRIRRTVVALHALSPAGQEFFVSLEGDFDVDAVRAGLTTHDVPFTVVEGGLLVALPGSGELRLTASRAVVAVGIDAAAALGEEGAEELLGHLGSLPVELAVDLERLEEVVRQNGATLPEIVPERVGVRVPRRADEPLVVEARCSAPAFATALEGLIEGLGRMLEPAVEAAELDERLLERAGAIAVEREGAALVVRVPLPSRSEAIALIEWLER